MKKQAYIIDQKKFKDLYKKIEIIHSNIALIKLVCEKYGDVDEFYIIMPTLKYTDNLADYLYAKFIDLKYKS